MSSSFCRYCIRKASVLVKLKESIVSLLGYMVSTGCFLDNVFFQVEVQEEENGK